MKIKYYLKKLGICLLLIFSFAFIINVSADSGWDTSYDSGSSYSGSSSWDSGSSSSSSWGDSSHYGSRDGSSSLDFDDVIVIIIVLFVIFFVAPYYLVSTGKSIDSKYSDVDENKLKELLNSNLVEIKSMAYTKFILIQKAWMNFEYEKLRELCTDELYNSYITELETLKLKNGQNIMDDFVCLSSRVFSVEEENDIITIKVYMKMKFYDYVINTKTNQVIRGNKVNKIINNYEMTFIKSKNNISKETKCPNCGAEIKMNTSGVCEYCRTVLVKESSDFVLSKKINVNRR